MTNKELYCYLIDSSMNMYVIKQDKIQKLLDNKDIAPLDILEQVGNDGNIEELLEELVCRFNCNDKYTLEYIANYFNDLVVENMEEE